VVRDVAGKEGSLELRKALGDHIKKQCSTFRKSLNFEQGQCVRKGTLRTNSSAFLVVIVSVHGLQLDREGF
jgi:hypothetical protein